MQKADFDYSPQFVFSLLATVPERQVVQNSAPAELMVFVAQELQEVILELLYVPAGQFSKRCEHYNYQNWVDLTVVGQCLPF